MKFYIIFLLVCSHVINLQHFILINMELQLLVLFHRFWWFEFFARRNLDVILSSPSHAFGNRGAVVFWTHTYTLGNKVNWLLGMFLSFVKLSFHVFCALHGATCIYISVYSFLDTKNVVCLYCVALLYLVFNKWPQHDEKRFLDQPFCMCTFL